MENTISQENLDKFLNLPYEKKDSIGICTEQLNDFAENTSFATFYDRYTFSHRSFYLKEPQIQTLANQGKRRVEFFDIALRMLLLFWLLCDSNHISTRCMPSFLRDLGHYLSEHEQDKEASYEAAILLLLASAGFDFLFDHNIVDALPPQFISRTHLLNQQRRDEDYRLKGVERIFSDEAFQEMEQQLVKFHMSLPSSHKSAYRIKFELLPGLSTFFRKTIWDDAKNGQLSADITQGFSDEAVQSVSRAFIWYLSCLDKVGGNDKTASNSTVRLTIYDHYTMVKLLPAEAADMLQKDIDGENSQFNRYILQLLESIGAICEMRPQTFLIVLYYSLIKERSKVVRMEQILRKAIENRMLIQTGDRAKTLDINARQQHRCNLLLFSRLCKEMEEYLGKDLSDYTQYLLEVSEDISYETLPHDDLLFLEAKADEIFEYIHCKSREEGATHLMMDIQSAADRIAKSAFINPLKLLSYYPWSVTETELYTYLHNARGSHTDPEKRGGGKRQKMLTTICDAIDAHQTDKTMQNLMDRYNYYVLDYYRGYGSGISEYLWAYELSSVVNRILEICPELVEYGNGGTQNVELLTLGIHTVLLFRIADIEENRAQVLLKRLLYREDSSALYAATLMIRKIVLGDLE